LTGEHPSSASSSCHTTARGGKHYKGDTHILRTAARIAVSSTTPMVDAQKQHARYMTRGAGVLGDMSQSGVETTYGEHEPKSRRKGSREHAPPKCDGFVTGVLVVKRDGERPNRGLRAAAAAARRVLVGYCGPYPPNEGARGAHGGTSAAAAAAANGRGASTTRAEKVGKMKKTTDGEGGRCILGRGYGCGLTRTRWDKEEKKKYFVCVSPRVSSTRSTTILVEPDGENGELSAQSASGPPTRRLRSTERNEIHHSDYSRAAERGDLFTSAKPTMTAAVNASHALNPPHHPTDSSHPKLRDTSKTTTTSTSTPPSPTSLTCAPTTTTRRMGDMLLNNKRLAGRRSLLFQPTKAQPKWFDLDKRFKSEEEAYVKVMEMLDRAEKRVHDSK